MKRRSFLRKLAYIPALTQISNPLDLPASTDLTRNGVAGKGRKLVLIELAGGNDGLNTVVPFTSESYYQARPNLAIQKNQVHKLTDTLGLHPALFGFKRLFDDRKLAIIQGVGSPLTIKSHYQARKMWHTLHKSMDLETYVDHFPFQKFSEDLTGYPASHFDLDLQNIARAIAMDSPTQVFKATLEGFDTHFGQIARSDNASGVHAELLEELSNSLSVFIADLNNTGNEGRVITAIFSEFGRKLEENNSLGTDHGTANPIFVIGSCVNPGIFGCSPSLESEKLDLNGDLEITVDIHSVFETLSRNWLNPSPTLVMGSRPPFLEFV